MSGNITHPAVPVSDLIRLSGLDNLGENPPPEAVGSTNSPDMGRYDPAADAVRLA